VAVDGIAIRFFVVAVGMESLASMMRNGAVTAIDRYQTKY
jgi:hypothetical protein